MLRYGSVIKKSSCNLKDGYFQDCRQTFIVISNVLYNLFTALSLNHQSFHGSLQSLRRKAVHRKHFSQLNMCLSPKVRMGWHGFPI